MSQKSGSTVRSACSNFSQKSQQVIAELRDANDKMAAEMAAMKQMMHAQLANQVRAVPMALDEQVRMAGVNDITAPLPTVPAFTLGNHSLLNLGPMLGSRADSKIPSPFRQKDPRSQPYSSPVTGAKRFSKNVSSTLSVTAAVEQQIATAFCTAPVEQDQVKGKYWNAASGAPVGEDQPDGSELGAFMKVDSRSKKQIRNEKRKSDPANGKKSRMSKTEKRNSDEYVTKVVEHEAMVHHTGNTDTDVNMGGDGCVENDENDGKIVGSVVLESKNVTDKSPFGVKSFSQAVENYVRAGKSCTQEPYPVFKTPKPLGGFRDEFVIEINSFNGRPFNGTVTPTEARLVIYEQILGLKQRDLAGITIGFNNGRVITYKMKQQFNIDSLHRPEGKFNFTRSTTNKSGQVMEAVVSCKIRGTRKEGTRREPSSTNVQAGTPYVDDGLRTVRVEGCEYRLTESEILAWLSKLGTVTSEIREEAFDERGECSSDELPTIGNGCYIVEMRLTKSLPNFVPMFGKQVKLYHNGITKQCNNCYGNHLKKVCKSDKVPYVSYVAHFKSKHQDIPAELYGKWQDIIPATESDSSTNRQSREDTQRVPLSSRGSCQGAETVRARAGAVGGMVNIRNVAPWAKVDKGTDEPTERFGAPNRPHVPLEDKITTDQTTQDSTLNTVSKTVENMVGQMMAGLKASLKPSAFQTQTSTSANSNAKASQNISGGRGRGRGRGKSNASTRTSNTNVDHSQIDLSQK